MRTISISTVLILTAALAGSAWAQEEGEEGGEAEGEAEGTAEGEVTPPPDAPPPPGADAGTEGAPPMILPQGKIAVMVGIGIGLSKEAGAGVGGAGKPIDITPDIWYGVMPKLEVGVAHSGYALTGFWGDSTPLGLAGTGVCLTGTDGCGDKLYNGPVGLMAHYALMESADMGIAADAGVITTLDPMELSVKLGIRGSKRMGKISIDFAPGIAIGITERDTGNKEYIMVPVSVGYMVSPKLNAGVQTGIQGPLSEFGDFYSIPVSLGALFMVNPNITVGGAFTLHRVAGFDGPGAGDLRSLTLVAMWHT